MHQKIAGRVLVRVVYYNLPNAAWDLIDGMHHLDFGLDLEFADHVVGITWADYTYELAVTPQSVRGQLRNQGPEFDASNVQPWRDALGDFVHDVADGEPVNNDALHGQPCRWSRSITLASGITVWLAAANYVGPEVLIPCGDELLVIHDPVVAARLGLA